MNTTAAEQLKQTSLLTIKQVAQVLGVAEMTIRRWEHAGLFPKALRIGRRYARWRAETIQHWLKNRG